LSRNSFFRSRVVYRERMNRDDGARLLGVLGTAARGERAEARDDEGATQHGWWLLLSGT